MGLSGGCELSRAASFRGLRAFGGCGRSGAAGVRGLRAVSSAAVALRRPGGHRRETWNTGVESTFGGRRRRETWNTGVESTFAGRRRRETWNTGVESTFAGRRRRQCVIATPNFTSEAGVLRCEVAYRPRLDRTAQKRGFPVHYSPRIALWGWWPGGQAPVPSPQRSRRPGHTAAPNHAAIPPLPPPRTRRTHNPTKRLHPFFPARRAPSRLDVVL